MTDNELFKLAFKCGLIAWTRHDYLAEKKDFRDLPIDEGMDGDGASLIQFARQVAANERAKCVKAIEKECEDWDREYKEMALELAGTIEGLE